ncbi:MAG: disulfide bond formation protein B [Burkholderiaceae bacterium]
MAGFLVCTGLIGIALYLQYVRGLEPCPLCMIQRVVFIAVGLVFLIAALAGPKGAFVRIYGVLAAALAATGIGFAVRHVWLQWYPPAMESCTADLFTQLQRLPFASVIEKALYATGDCARVDWTLLGLSIAEWSLIWFVALTVLSVIYLTRRPRNRSNWL